LWGDTCDVRALGELSSDRGIPVYYDSAHAFGCSTEGRRVGGFGALEVFSFHATKVLSATEGGCIATNDDDLAARLRNIRSSYGAGTPVPVPITANGRFSEAQAAIALMSLEDVATNIDRNKLLLDTYRSSLQDVPGIRVLAPSRTTEWNGQYAVLEVNESVFGLSRDRLLAVLKAENVNARRYFWPGVHRVPPFASDSHAPMPNAEAISKVIMQLPVGAMVTEDGVSRIGRLIELSHLFASELAKER
jgi:dTDP-4-amino-4,6-dideoxygalactose transaminase